MTVVFVDPTLIVPQLFYKSLYCMALQNFLPTNLASETVSEQALVTWVRNTVPQSLFSPAFKNIHIDPSWYDWKFTHLFYNSPQYGKETIIFVENMSLYFYTSLCVSTSS